MSAECASELDVQLNRIGCILSVRWLSYQALHLHFTRKASDPLTESREKAKFSGLAKKLESSTFIKNLGLMHDALEELSDLSLALQRADISLRVANKLVSRQVEVFVSRKTTESVYYRGM